MKKLLMLMMLGLFMISLVSAVQTTIGTFELNKEVNLFQVCDACGSITISAVTYPNSSIALENVDMSSTDTYYYNYTIDSNYTGALGTYTVNGYDDATNAFAYDFTITENGSPESSGIVTVAFTILLFLILFFMLSTFFLTLSGLAHRDFYIKDIIITIISYIGLIIFNYLARIFFPKILVTNLLMILMKIGVWTHIVLPIVVFIIIMLLEWNRYNIASNDSDGYVPINYDMNMFGERRGDTSFNNQQDNNHNRRY